MNLKAWDNRLGRWERVDHSQIIGLRGVDQVALKAALEDDKIILCGDVRSDYTQVCGISGGTKGPAILIEDLSAANLAAAERRKE